MTMSLSHFLGDPFAISTISFGVIGWIVAIAGAAALDQPVFPHFSWWGIVYEFVLIFIIFLLYLNNNIELYKFTLVGLVSIAFIYTTNSINSLIYNSKSGANLACAAGCILLSILNLIWILYFGGHPESPTNQFIDSFSLKSHNHGHLPNTEMSNDNRKLDHRDEDDDYKRYVLPVNLPHAGSTHFQDNNLRQSQLTTKNNTVVAGSLAPGKNSSYMSSSQLNGLENFSSSDVQKPTHEQRHSIVGAGEITFRYKARALYSYDANPEDSNEISFGKDEILEVDDIDGKWWQARRANGQVGICPLNYVKLLD